MFKFNILLLKFVYNEWALVSRIRINIYFLWIYMLTHKLLFVERVVVLDHVSSLAHLSYLSLKVVVILY